MANIFNLTLTDYDDGTDLSIRPYRDYDGFIVYLTGDRTSSTFTATISNSLAAGTQSVIATFDVAVTFGTFNVCGVDGDYTQLVVTMDDVVTGTIPPLPLRRDASRAAIIGTNVYYYDLFEDNAGDKDQIIEGYVEVIDVVGI